ncbi:hypothetical protein Q5Y73_15305 [Chengkuizengella sp. 2205SS18-9]|uniref:Lysine--tRNA ligase n=1 Tax=Chengkuizengella axinellae TaxID=3064388 RepID=A0ABT9J388_9BACL|nr:hypothetical protein [Chengkuizengella sp. 2205SS18-9]MDP5275475.1 hypothetical protein [Chengkuizengella sp. 2205SS18-9]
MEKNPTKEIFTCASGISPSGSVHVGNFREVKICRQSDKKKMLESQKDLFKNVYQLVMNDNSGPRLPLLIAAVGRESMIELLTFQAFT